MKVLLVREPSKEQQKIIEELSNDVKALKMLQ